MPLILMLMLLQRFEGECRLPTVAQLLEFLLAISFVRVSRADQSFVVIVVNFGQKYFFKIKNKAKLRVSKRTATRKSFEYA